MNNQKKKKILEDKKKLDIKKKLKEELILVQKKIFKFYMKNQKLFISIYIYQLWRTNEI